VYAWSGVQVGCRMSRNAPDETVKNQTDKYLFSKWETWVDGYEGYW